MASVPSALVGGMSLAFTTASEFFSISSFSRSRFVTNSWGSLSVNIFQCTAQIWKLKTESGFEEPLRRAAAAGERQGRFGSHQPRAQAHAPSGRRRTPRAVQHTPQFP